MLYPQVQVSPDHTWRAKEVIHEIDGKPHLLVAVEISGPYFPERAAPPFARVLSVQGETIPAWFALISTDSRKLTAYFPVEVPLSGTMEFGYGHKVTGRLNIGVEQGKLQQLDRSRLPEGVIVTRREHMKEKRKTD